MKHQDGMSFPRWFLLPWCTLGLLGVMLSACLTTHMGGDGVSGGAVVQTPEEQIVAFAHANFDHLKADMARGEGDHLQTLAVLLGIGPEQQAEFYTFTHDAFPVLFPSDHVAAREMVTFLTRELAHHPQLHQLIVMR